MNRKLNAPASAGWRHVMNRTEPGADWIRDRADAASFLARVGEVCATLPLDLHGYCLLPRHFHLLVRADDRIAEEAAARLERASPVLAAAARRVVPVAFGRHLMETSRYIHLNPVEAGLTWRPEDWPFSSLRGYLGDPSAPKWLTTEAVLGRFGTIGARHRYLAYVNAGMDPGTRDARGRPRWAVLFGASSVLEDLAWRIEPVLSFRAPGRKAAGPRPGMPPVALVRAIAASFDVSEESLRSVGRGGPRAALARGALVHAARREGGYRLADVAAWLGYASPAAAAVAAERFDRALRAYPHLAARLPPP